MDLDLSTLYAPPNLFLDPSSMEVDPPGGLGGSRFVVLISVSTEVAIDVVSSVISPPPEGSCDYCSSGYWPYGDFFSA